MTFVRTEPGADPIIVEGRFDAPPERVFEAWTEPDIIKRWFGAEPGSLVAASVDLRPGGRWRFTEKSTASNAIGFEGEYLEIVPGRLLTFTWAKFVERAGGSRDATPSSRVEITFTASGVGTELRIVHSNLDQESRGGFGIGWERGTTNLAALLAG